MLDYMLDIIVRITNCTPFVYKILIFLLEKEIYFNYL